jgi:hypothetical protein
MPDFAIPLASVAVPADPPAGGFSIRRRGEDLEACRKILDDFENAHLEEANSTGGPISITRRDFAKLRGDLDEAFRRQVDYVATFWSTTNDRIAAEDAYLRGALKICIKRMCEYCRADAAHSMPGKECLEGCETLRLVKKALGEEEDDHA